MTWTQIYLLIKYESNLGFKSVNTKSQEVNNPGFLYLYDDLFYQIRIWVRISPDISERLLFGNAPVAFHIYF